MMKTRKIMAGFMAVISMASFVSCGGGDEETKTYDVPIVEMQVNEVEVNGIKNKEVEVKDINIIPVNMTDEEWRWLNEAYDSGKISKEAYKDYITNSVKSK